MPSSSMIVYSAESSVLNFKTVLRDMLRGLMQSRYTAYRIFVKDMKADYMRSRLGVFWDFIDPLVFASIFFTLEKLGVIARGDIGQIPYVVYVVFGFLLYSVYMDAILMPIDILRKSRQILTHVKITPESILVSVFFRVVFNASFRMVAMIGFAIGFGAFTIPGLIGFVAAMPLFILCGMGIGIFLAPYHTIYNDVGTVVRIILTPLRFASPVIYALPWPFLYRVNPLAGILDAVRSLATGNTFEHLSATVAWVALHMVLLLVGWFVFHIALPILADQA